MFAHHNLAATFHNGPSNHWQVGDCCARSWGVNSGAPLAALLAEPGTPPWLWSPVQNRANENDLSHCAVHACAHTTKTEAILYKYPVDTESNWACSPVWTGCWNISLACLTFNLTSFFVVWTTLFSSEPRQGLIIWKKEESALRVALAVMG